MPQVLLLGRWSWWEKERFAGLAAQWSVLLWQKRETWGVAKEAPCSSTYLEEQFVPTKVVVGFFSDAYTVRSTGKMDEVFGEAWDAAVPSSCLCCSLLCTAKYLVGI